MPARSAGRSQEGALLEVSTTLPEDVQAAAPSWDRST